MDDQTQHCRRVIFVGRVQGVGFRYTTSRIARGFPVKGFVRNLADGTVELIAAGEAEQVTAFLDEVHRRFAGNIDTGATVAEDIPLPEDFTVFEVR